MNKIICACVVFLLIGCNTENEEKEKSEVIQKSTNTILLLDLSDRILNNQSERDLLLIGNVYQSRIGYLLKNPRSKQDAISTVIAPQNGVSNLFSPQNENLKIDLAGAEKNKRVIYLKNKLGFDLTMIPKEKLGTSMKLITPSIDKIYSTILKDKTKPQDFAGSDLWKFFNNNLNDYLIEDENIENHLIIFTDGYLDFEDPNSNLKVGNRYPNSTFLKHLRIPNWKQKFEEKDYGIKQLNNAPKTNFRVSIVELNPKVDDFTEEKDLLIHMWKKWLNEMGVTQIDILDNTLSTSEVVKKLTGASVTQIQEPKKKDDAIVINDVSEIKKESIENVIQKDSVEIIIKTQSKISIKLESLLNKLGKNESNSFYKKVLSYFAADAKVIIEGKTLPRDIETYLKQVRLTHKTEIKIISQNGNKGNITEIRVNK